MLAQNLSILIVESEAYFAQKIAELVEETGCHVAACIDNISAALSVLKENSLDLILLSANITKQTKAAATIAELEALKIPIIYIVNVKENHSSIKIDCHNAFGLMFKAVDKFTLNACIELAIKKQAVQKHTFPPFAFNRELFFKKGGIYHKIEIDSIYFFQASGDYSLAQTFRGDYTTSLRLNKLEELLEHYSFMRVHRSYLINLAKVTAIDVENFWLNTNGHKIPFSRRIKTKLLKRIPLL